MSNNELILQIYLQFNNDSLTKEDNQFLGQ